jgi:hypothetical protein
MRVVIAGFDPAIQLVFSKILLEIQLIIAYVFHAGLSS